MKHPKDTTHPECEVLLKRFTSAALRYHHVILYNVCSPTASYGCELTYADALRRIGKQPGIGMYITRIDKVNDQYIFETPLN